MERKVVLSGMRPTGKLHLGHWVGALSNWVRLQEEYQCFFFIADWHALLSEYKDPSRLSEYAFDNLCDWLACGIDPRKSVIFVQSELSEHLELFMIFSTLVPLGWLSRCPTFKEQIAQLKDKEVNTYGFLGYPALQAADIVLYNAQAVPVGEDQLPHLELCREIVRRFHTLYAAKVFVEPQPLLTATPRFMGLDGRKMSKSYNNFIALDEDDESIQRKVLSMITDPARKAKSDPGHPEVCSVHDYYRIFIPELANQASDWCTKALKGCVDCKQILSEHLKGFIGPKRARKAEFLKQKQYVRDVLEEGKNKARQVASRTLAAAKKAMGIERIFK